MPLFNVRRTLHVQSGVDAIYPLIRDFTQWKIWSPWLLAEPDCKIEYASDGRTYEWKGKIVGSGRMELLEEKEGAQIDYRLTFLEPWKSVNSTAFTFQPRDGGTDVVWTMEGTLPWFLFWMKGMMTNFIGMDYDRGLRMLKDLAETGQVPSTVVFRGSETIPAIRYFGIQQEGAIAQIGEDMSAAFRRLETFIAESAITRTGPPRSIYHKWAMSKGTTRYTVACPVETLPANLPDGFTTGETPAHSAYVIEHTGPYRHLGNAWAAGMMHERSKVFAKNKKAPPYEIYVSDPKETAETALVTRVCFPSKP